MSAKVITVAQQKGGAGKTTLVAHLASLWSGARKSVAVVDIDPQGSLAAWYAAREDRFGEDDTGLTFSAVTGWRTANEVERLARDHDVVLVDSPPHAETEAKIAVRASSLVLVPVQPSPMDVWATRPTLALAKGEKRQALLVLTRVPPRARLTEAMLDEVKKFDAGVARSRVGNRVAFATTLLSGRGVSEAASGSPAAKEMANLAREVLREAA